MSDAEAWKDFWATNARVEQGGCLPQRWAAIEDAQRGCWHSFIADVEQGAEVLDLATGDGRVLGWMQTARPDLVLTRPLWRNCHTGGARRNVGNYSICTGVEVGASGSPEKAPEA